MVFSIADTLHCAAHRNSTGQIAWLDVEIEHVIEIRFGLA